jgi:lysophospholipase L1-like esterase
MKHVLRYATLILIFLQYTAHSQNVQTISDWVNYKKYEEANRNLPPLAPGEHRVVFMGNSITESWAVIDSSFFVDHGYIGRGISGQTSAQMLLRFRQDVIDLKPTVVVILAGTNDIAQNAGPISVEHIVENIVSMVDLAEQNNIKTILTSVLPAYDFPWRKGLQPAEKIVKLDSLIKSYCDLHSIPYVDCYAKMVDERKGLDTKYTLDGVHPTLDGYKLMDSLVEPEIETVLKSQ